MLEEMIEKALNENVDLPDKEYKEKIVKSDFATESHGVKGNAPISESKRHKRIQMNFYGIALNYIANILGELSVQTQQLQQQNLMLLALLKERGINVEHATE